jgi:succinate dehydrogenase hydrophobic anchor subunit
MLIVVFWIVMPCSFVGLRNILAEYIASFSMVVTLKMEVTRSYLQGNMASQLRRP